MSIYDRQAVKKITKYVLTCPFCKTVIELDRYQNQVKCPTCQALHECYLKNS
jgi:LSD1 subclass zinc finger protein